MMQEFLVATHAPVRDASSIRRRRAAEELHLALHVRQELEELLLLLLQLRAQLLVDARRAAPPIPARVALVQERNDTAKLQNVQILTLDLQNL